MLDIRWIRENQETLDKALASRGVDAKASELMKLDEQRRELMAQLQELQSRRNTLSKAIGQAKAKGENATQLFAEMKTVGPKVKELEDKERAIKADFEAVLAMVPNIPDNDVPEGADEDDNVEIRRVGEPKKFSFTPQPHYQVGEDLEMMDFETAAKISGSRFVWMQGDLARLERALATFMLDILREKGFLEVMPPLLVNDTTMFGTGQLPKFEDDQFHTTDGRWLIPTAEVVLTNYAQNEILDEDKLPYRFCAWTPCFRKEAGSAGRDTRGYNRMHQFMKVEMVQIVHPDYSEKALEYMTGCAEDILQKLELPYRVMVLCTGDMGFSARKTYDLEVWVPAQETYREISSCSNCGDFQARRMKARFRNSDGETEFVHTLNGSGLAVGRTLVAVMENYQREDGSIEIPKVLQPYMNGQEVIKKA